MAPAASFKALHLRYDIRSLIPSASHAAEYQRRGYRGDDKCEKGEGGGVEAHSHRCL